MKTNFIKQNDHHSCYPCAVAMATNTKLKDIIKFVGHDGNEHDPKSEHPDKKKGFSHLEMYRYLAHCGFVLGAIGANVEQFSEPLFDGNFTHLTIEVKLSKYSAILIVKSINFENVDHCLYWDGEYLYDPNIGEVSFGNYDLKEYWPVLDLNKI